MSFQHLIKNSALHFRTITKHKILVMKECFAVGLYWQGVTHDLSKYTWTEFHIGCQYYQGSRSPNNAEREALGFSSAWLHHKGRNKHHYEYWLDYDISGKKLLSGTKMPVRYVVEMFLDRVAASKIYRGDEYKEDDALIYFLESRDHSLMHEDTKKILLSLLKRLALTGEEATFDYIRNNLVRGFRWKSIWEYFKGDYTYGKNY